MPAANGAGFKSGGYGYPPNTPATGAAHHVIRFNLAFANRVIGFYANFHPGGIDFLHNTAFDNPANFDMRTPGTPSSHTLRNNLAAGSGRTIINFDGGTDDYNSWTLPVTVTADDFMSLDHALAYEPRQADGTLPRTRLAQLRAGSDLIDRGEDRGFPFSGNAPDLGAYEVGLTRTDEPTEPKTPDDPDAGVPIGSMPSAGQSGTAAPGARAGTSGAMTRAGASGMTASTTGASIAQTGVAGGAGAARSGLAAPDASRASGCGCRIASAAQPFRGAFVLTLIALVCMRLRLRTRHR